jgi:hypothetical protein
MGAEAVTMAQKEVNSVQLGKRATALRRCVAASEEHACKGRGSGVASAHCIMATANVHALRQPRLVTRRGIFCIFCRSRTGRDRSARPCLLGVERLKARQVLRRGSKSYGVEEPVWRWEAAVRL